MSTSSVICVILITVQIYYVLTLSPLINCTDCDILNFFINKSRTNALSKQEDIGSQLNIHALQQLTVDNYFERSIYSMEENGTISNDSTAIEQLTTDSTLISIFTALSEVQSNITEETVSLSVTLQSTTITFAEMTGTEYAMATPDTSNSNSFSETTTVMATRDTSNSNSFSETTTVMATPDTSYRNSFSETTTVMATPDISNSSSFSEITEIDTNMSFDTKTTNNLNITSDDSISTTTPLTKSEKNLPLILGLTLGLGLPVCLAIVGSVVYYLKIYRPRTSQVVVLNG